MTDKELFNRLLDLFKFDVDPWSYKIGELHIIEKHSRLEVFFYDGIRGDRIVNIKNEHDFIRLFGAVKTFGSFPKAKENPFFGCRSKEEIIIKMDMMIDVDEQEF